MFDTWDAGMFGLVDGHGEQVALAGVEVRADVVGRGVKATLAQRFVNTEARPIEAVYRFPLPEGGAVCGFRVRVGDRLIESVIEEREEAFRRYDEALADGHGGYLLDEERPNVFAVSVGNLEPGGEAVVEVDLVGLLEATGPRVRLYVPTTISPRYTPAGAAGPSRQAPGGTLNPPFALTVQYGLRLQLTVHNPDGIASVTSPSHDLTVDTTDSTVQATFAAGTVQMDRDLVVDIDHTGDLAARGHWCTVDGDTYVLLDLALPEPDPATVDRDREIVFVIDCSGSMMGTSIGQARQALTILLRSMPDHTRFNVLRFGTTYEQLFATPQPYTTDTACAALDWAEGIDADLGGTEMLPPLQAALTDPPAVAQREVFLLTDGEIHDDDAVVRLIDHHRAHNRLFSVGIGHGPNEYLMRQLARTTGGLAVMVAPGERLEPPVLRLFNRAIAERITHLQLAWPHPVEQAPATPAAHLGETVTITARTTHPRDTGSAPAKVTLTGRAADRHLNLDVPLDPVPADRSPLPQLWAREVIRDLEERTVHRARHGSQQDRAARDVTARIVELSRRFRVLSRHTSFVAIETRHAQDRTTEPSVLRRVPTMLTHDWHGLGWLQPTPPAHPSPSDPYQAHHLTLMAPGAPAGFGSRTASDATTASPGKQRPPRQQTSTGPTEDTLLHLLALQHLDGGFPLDQVADLTGIPIATLTAAGHQAAQVTSDPERLVATAIALALLHTRFPGHTNLWAPLVRKSERWLIDTLSTAPVTIGRQPLQDWARGLVAPSALTQV
jgi:Ca-activated chloride channel homolog